MNPSSALKLLALAAIWGGSFLLMRVGVTALSPALMIEARVVLAALFLLFASFWLKTQRNKPGFLSLLKHWKYFLVIGLFNSALPFLLFAWSAKTLPASMLSVLNATAPIWGTVIGVITRTSTLSPRSVAGLVSGVSGVAVLVGLDQISLQQGAPLAIAAALGAALCYGIASSYTRTAVSVTPFDNAHGSMWAAALWVLPLLVFSGLGEGVPGGEVVMAVILLGVVCTGIAYLLYFKLIADIGAPSALTVTFLIPVFGILWGRLVLNEVIGWHMVVGMIMVVAGTALVTGFSFAALVKALVKGRRVSNV